MVKNKNTDAPRYPSYLHYVILGVILLVLFLWQSAPGQGLTLFGVRPLPAVMLVALIGIVYGEFAGGLFGLIAGLLMDMYTTPSVCFNVVLLTALGMICGLAIQHLLIPNFYAHLVLTLGCCFVYYLFYFIVIQWLLGEGTWYYFFRFSLPATVYTWAVGMILYPFLRWLRRH